MIKNIYLCLINIHYKYYILYNTSYQFNLKINHINIALAIRRKNKICYLQNFVIKNSITILENKNKHSKISCKLFESKKSRKGSPRI